MRRNYFRKKANNLQKKSISKSTFYIIIRKLSHTDRTMFIVYHKTVNKTAVK